MLFCYLVPVPCTAHVQPQLPMLHTASTHNTPFTPAANATATAPAANAMHCKHARIQLPVASTSSTHMIQLPVACTSSTHTIQLPVPHNASCYAPPIHQHSPPPKKRYLQICANCDNYPLPPSDKLCSFVAYLAVSSLMNQTIKSYFSAIHHLQIVMNMGDAQISSMSKLEHVLWWGINKEQSKKTTLNKPYNPKHSHSIERGMGRSSPQLWSHYIMGSMLHLFLRVIEICGTVCSLRWGIWPLHTSQFLRPHSQLPWQNISHYIEDKGFKNRSLYARSHNLLRGNRHETLSIKIIVGIAIHSN